MLGFNLVFTDKYPAVGSYSTQLPIPTNFLMLFLIHDSAKLRVPIKHFKCSFEF